MYIYLNEGLVPEESALVPVTDRGFLYGDGVFETMRSYGGEVFMFPRHLERLRRSASRIGLVLPRDDEGMRKAVYETIAANSLTDASIRVTISRGTGPRGIDPTAETRQTMVVMAWPYEPYDHGLYEQGVSLVVAKTRRNSPLSLDPSVKSMNFLNNIMAKGEASRAGVFDALMLNLDGFVAECTVSNIFFVTGGEVFTPSLECGILPGITRDHVKELAMGMGIRVREGEYTPEELLKADEVFLTNTSMEVMPVGKIGTVSFDTGEITLRLISAYRESTP